MRLKNSYVNNVIVLKAWSPKFDPYDLIPINWHRNAYKHTTVERETDPWSVLDSQSSLMGQVQDSVR